MSCVGSSGGAVQHLSQSIIHSIQEGTGFYRKVRFCGSVRVHINIDDQLVKDHLSSLFHSEEFDELVAAHLTSSEVHSDFQIWCPPGFQMPSTVGSLTRHHDTKFVIGLNFAVTLSSPASSCVLFDIALHLLMELKWLILNKFNK